MDVSCLALILAQNDPSSQLWIGLLLMVGVFYMIILIPQRKERKQREQMLANIKKNDRVMTVGGVLGTVVSVSDHEVVVKVDESANVKMTFIRSAIQRVLTENEKPTEVR